MNSENYAPIVLFIYNRADHTQKTLEVLSQNILADKSDLFIFADGPKENASEEQLLKIQKTREVAKSQKWCKEVTVIESEKNKGLAASIISGVTDIINKYGKIIVLEDDIVTGKYFLQFMNDALNKYIKDKTVWHITGWRDPVKDTQNNSSFFYPIMDCWGWATWADRWQYYKKDTKYYLNIFNEKMKYHFNIEGTAGNFSQIEENDKGLINTWAIFWSATIFLNKGLCLAPSKSLVKNIGFDNSGVHCGDNEFQTIVDSIDNQINDFPKVVQLNKKEYKKNVLFYTKMANKTNFQRHFEYLKIIIKALIRRK